MFSTITARLAGQRKDQTYIISPMSDGQVMLQSSKAIGIFDPVTGEGILNIKGCYFPHLHAALGAKAYSLPPEILVEVNRLIPNPQGVTVLGGGVAIVQNMIEVI